MGIIHPLFICSMSSFYRPKIHSISSTSELYVVRMCLRLTFRIAITKCVRELQCYVLSTSLHRKRNLHEKPFLRKYSHSSPVFSSSNSISTPNSIFDFADHLSLDQYMYIKGKKAFDERTIRCSIFATFDSFGLLYRINSDWHPMIYPHPENLE